MAYGAVAPPVVPAPAPAPHKIIDTKGTLILHKNLFFM